MGLPSMLVDFKAVTAMTSKLGLVVRMSLNPLRPFSKTGILVMKGTECVAVMASGTAFCELCKSTS